jgi:ribosomal-protein-alanine N-acetyltransferase
VWENVRKVNREWLSPWEATRPEIESQLPLPNFYQMVLHHRSQGRRIESYALGIWLVEKNKERFIGQITLGGIVFGAMRGAYIGYWVDQRFANRGYVTRSVKLLTKYAFEKLLLHRIEINMRPENAASKKVAEKAGFTFEGIRPVYLHIDGAWRDHLSFYIANPLIQ